MPRPKKMKKVCFSPEYGLFKPSGAAIRKSDIIELQLDELEAVRLADFEEIYQEEAASAMDTSRPTFTKLLASAHKKIAQALLEGKALKIGGGNVEICNGRIFYCEDCNAEFTTPYGGGRPEACTECGSSNFYRTDRCCRRRGNRNCGGNFK